MLSVERLTNFNKDLYKFIHPDILEKPAFDFDGIIKDSRKLVTETFNKVYGTDYKTSDMRYFNAVRLWAKELGVSDNMAIKIEKGLWYDMDFLIQAKPVPGVVELLTFLNNKGVKTPIISSRPGDPAWIDSTKAWLRQNNLGFMINNLYIQPSTSTEQLPGELFKAYLINSLGIKIFFDDAPHQIKTIIDYTDCKAVLHSSVYYLDYLSQTGRFFRIPESLNGADLSPINNLFNVS